MIETPRFVITHIPKTGGDAIKQICSKLNLPNFSMRSIDDPNKHNPILPDDRDIILSFRRLPQRELSYYWHLRNYDKENLSNNVAEWIIENNRAENEIKRQLQGREPAHVIRSENLRSDLAKVLKNYYKITPQQKQIINRCKTKNRNPYNRKLSDYFSKEQLRKLYAISPLWAEIEKKVYGSLLID